MRPIASRPSTPHVDISTRYRNAGGSSGGEWLQGLSPFGEWSENLAVVCELRRAHPAKQLHGVGEASVGQPRHSEEASVEIIRRQQRFPDHRHQKGGPDQQAGAGGERAGRVGRAKRQGERQAPIRQQIDVIVRQRPIRDDAQRSGAQSGHTTSVRRRASAVTGAPNLRRRESADALPTAPSAAGAARLPSVEGSVRHPHQFASAWRAIGTVMLRTRRSVALSG